MSAFFPPNSSGSALKIVRSLKTAAQDQSESGSLFSCPSRIAITYATGGIIVWDTK
jgi:hypothetical protein